MTIPGSGRMLMFTVLLSVFVAMKQARAGDRVEVVGTEPPSPAVLHERDPLKVNVRCFLETTNEACFGMFPYVGNEMAVPSWGIINNLGSNGIVRGFGEHSFTVELDPCRTAIDRIRVWISRNTSSAAALATQFAPVDIRWVPVVSTNPFADVDVLVSANFPDAVSLVAGLQAKGIRRCTSGGRGSEPWCVRVGRAVDIRVAQEILREALRRDTNLWGVTVNGPNDSVWGSNSVDVLTARNQMSIPPMPRTLLDTLLNPELTSDDFFTLVTDDEIKLRSAVAAVEEVWQKAAKIPMEIQSLVPVDGLASFYRFADASDSCDVGDAFDFHNCGVRDEELEMTNEYTNCSAKAAIGCLDFGRVTVGVQFRSLGGAMDSSQIFSGGREVDHGWSLLSVGGMWLQLSAAPSSWCLTATVAQFNWNHVYTSARLKTNTWHWVVVSADFRAGKLLTILDGQSLPEVALPARKDLADALARTPDNQRCVGFDRPGYAEVFYGTADNLILYSRALSLDEMRKVSSALDVHRGPFKKCQ